MMTTFRFKSSNLCLGWSVLLKISIAAKDFAAIKMTKWSLNMSCLRGLSPSFKWSGSHEQVGWGPRLQAIYMYLYNTLEKSGYQTHYH